MNMCKHKENRLGNKRIKKQQKSCIDEKRNETMTESVVAAAISLPIFGHLKHGFLTRLTLLLKPQSHSDILRFHYARREGPVCCYSIAL